MKSIVLEDTSTPVLDLSEAVSLKRLGSLLARAPLRLLPFAAISSTMKHGLWQSSNEQVSVAIVEYGQPPTHQGFQLPPSPCIYSLEEINRLHQQHGLAAVMPPRINAPDTRCGGEDGHMLSTTSRASNVRFTYSRPSDTTMVALTHEQ